MRLRILIVVASGIGLLASSCGRPETPTTSGAAAQQAHSVTGVVLSLDPANYGVTVRHQTIPGYMQAMTMPFTVRDTNELAGLIPGEEITFTMIVTEEDAWIQHVEKTGVAENLLPSGSGIRIVRDVDPLEIGDALPDYPFVDERGRSVQLSEFEGQALILSFLFTRCPLPTFCPLTARKLAEVQDRLLAASSPTNWHILAITIDPGFDTPERLQRFGESHGYKPEHWSFLTGEMIDITALAEQFGLVFWTGEEMLNHNLRTVLVGADGLVQTNMVGNDWDVNTVVEAVVQGAQRAR
jgi:protein SCO1/2